MNTLPQDLTTDDRNAEDALSALFEAVGESFALDPNFRIRNITCSNCLFGLCREGGLPDVVSFIDPRKKVFSELEHLDVFDFSWSSPRSVLTFLQRWYHFGSNTLKEFSFDCDEDEESEEDEFDSIPFWLPNSIETYRFLARGCYDSRWISTAFLMMPNLKALFLSEVHFPKFSLECFKTFSKLSHIESAEFQIRDEIEAADIWMFLEDMMVNKSLTNVCICCDTEDLDDIGKRVEELEKQWKQVPLLNSNIVVECGRDGDICEVLVTLSRHF